MPDFHLGRQQITISYNCRYHILNMVLITVYQFQNYPNLTVICCRYIIIYNQSNHTSLKPLHSNNKCYAPCTTLWSVDARPFLLAHTSQNKAIVVTMETKCNSHQQYSAVLRLQHGLSPFL